MKFSFKLVMLVFLMSLLASWSFAKGDVLSGGDTGRNPVLGVNFVFGKYWAGAELEVDIGLGKAISIAPRLGIARYAWVSPGCSLRFAIIKGQRPHGFWVGPSIDFIFHEYNNDDDLGVIFTPAAEFGWRYTFDFGLSLQPFTRLGVYTGHETGFFWVLAVGIGYAF